MVGPFDISDLLGYASITCWLGAQFPQVVENIRRKSCEGLALPFLANWLLGDISNLVGCILTHQLPFQTWLATYFVCVDCMLVAQYWYYYKSPKHPQSGHSHLRSSTTIGRGRRMSVDRGASRYRTLSAVASNVAAAAALAAQQDDQADVPKSARFSHHVSHRLRHQRENMVLGGSEGEEGDPPSSMFESFYSEGGKDATPKRVSWSIERHGGRAASVGRSGIPTPLDLASVGNLHESVDALTDSPTPLVSSRSSRATRRGSTMVFLGVWTLFGLGSWSNAAWHRPSTSLVYEGRVLSTPFPNTLSFTPLSPLVPPPNSLHFTSTVHARDYSDWIAYDDPQPDEPSNQQVLGRIFAWLCTTLYLTSRLPQIWKNYARKSVEGLSMYLFVFAFLGNVFYVASILLSPRRYLPPPEASKYIHESIPYLLGSGGTLLFDITIVGQSFCYRPRHRRTTVAYSRLRDEEEGGLLSAEPFSSTHSHADASATDRGRTSRSRDAAIA